MKIPAEKIKNLAKEIGFSDCGITNISVEQEVKKFYKNWIENNFNAEMKFLENEFEKRFEPKLVFPKAKSVIVFIINYYSKDCSLKEYKISKYAQAYDYHFIIKDKLRLFSENLKQEYLDFEAYEFCDTAPVFEKYFASQAGLGFIGKNRCLISPKFGSWVFIGGMFCNAEIKTDSKLDIYCGDCDICIKSCPTGALSLKGLEADKCISYHTIENKNEVPENIRKKITNQLFGCDICQDSCPYNKNPIPTSCVEFLPKEKVYNLDFEELANISNKEFLRRFKNTSLLRAGRKKIIANFENINYNRNK
ncbi:MAG TPA: tRNA epoxyqueuosine(34) reductase QueG [Bacteroidales bacterium]|nr:tRNA epoxyqueuosine(34) reductase QueG [Bacteroidales bacterium]HOR61054.1 tRNA epoxyqueuosine(34) reductase QueG [Bacteroidales bacterium]HPL05280.1 tRNA epoxyqueuosine(34) reductase QueG [Bacteroidales bacterium]HPX76276.1 tRNA epoxyqueuosine(34) reductase QueG [Bacteroidales bacterium]HQB20853.1 tRNA epoxyqueuosine(34) reductase QueG [Bacteroidales bacterium]